MTRVAEAERVVRHRLPDRLYHWTMAAAVLTLLGTGFLPILGWKFEWVTAHWIAGVVLAALVTLHFVRACFWLDFWSMVVGFDDVRSGWRAIIRPQGSAAAQAREIFASPETLPSGRRRRRPRAGGDRRSDAAQDRHAAVAP